MPRLIPFRLAAVSALALALLLSSAALALAKGPVADLRVVGADGKILDEDSFGVGPASVKTSPRATCFGAGTGGSGKTVAVKGPSALSMLVQASRFTAALKPLQLTDAFSFGLGLCGVGRSHATKTLSWYLKVDHRSPEIAGEAAKVKQGDEVLWALTSYPYPDELALSVPRLATVGEPFGVRVFAYDDKGRRKPAAGVTVTGASAVTGADGRTTVILGKSGHLVARHGDDIPARAFVCAGGNGVVC